MRAKKLTAVAGGREHFVIFVTPEGQGGWRYTTPAMYRAKTASDGGETISVYGDEA